MITLIDTFNNVIISKHRNIQNAIKAMYKHIKGVQKYNSKDSYLTYEIRDSSGKKISNSNLETAKDSLGSLR
jgi:iron uptake system EfeUOB component EfeO/EfeM